MWLLSLSQVNMINNKMKIHGRRNKLLITSKTSLRISITLLSTFIEKVTKLQNYLAKNGKRNKTFMKFNNIDSLSSMVKTHITMDN